LNISLIKNVFRSKRPTIKLIETKTGRITVSELKDKALPLRLEII
jgi:hypothetical protein